MWVPGLGWAGRGGAGRAGWRPDLLWPRSRRVSRSDSSRTSGLIAVGVTLAPLKRVIRRHQCHPTTRDITDWGCARCLLCSLIDARPRLFSRHHQCYLTSFKLTPSLHLSFNPSRSQLSILRSLLHWLIFSGRSVIYIDLSLHSMWSKMLIKMEPQMLQRFGSGALTLMHITTK